MANLRFESTIAAINLAANTLFISAPDKKKYAALVTGTTKAFFLFVSLCHLVLLCCLFRSFTCLVIKPETELDPFYAFFFFSFLADPPQNTCKYATLLFREVLLVDFNHRITL